MTRRAWWVVAAWVVVTTVIILVAPSLASVSSSQTNLVPASSESAQAQRLAEREFPESAKATSVFVVKRVDGAKLGTADLAKVQAFADGLNAAHIPRVAGVFTNSTMVAPNGTAQLVSVVLAGSQSDRALQDAVAPLRDKASVLLAGSGLEAGLTGPVAALADTTAAVNSAARMVGMATVVLILVLLSAVFRSPLAALLPVVSIGLVYELSIAVLALVAKGIGFRIDQTLTPMLIVVLFGIGTDYVLFLLFRYRERLRAGDEPRAAMVTSVTRAGKAIASSGLVVLAAVAVLFLAQLQSFRTIAPTLLIAVALMLLASLTLVPSSGQLDRAEDLLAFQRLEDRPAKPSVDRRGRPGRPASRLDGARVRRTARRPLRCGDLHALQLRLVRVPPFQ